MHFSANESIARQHIAELEAEAEKRRLVRSGRSHRRTPNPASPTAPPPAEAGGGEPPARCHRSLLAMG